MTEANPSVLAVVLQDASASSWAAPNAFLFAKDLKRTGIAVVAKLYFGRADIVAAVVVVR